MGKRHKIHVVRDFTGKIVGIGADADDASRIAADHQNLGRGACTVAEEEAGEEHEKVPAEAPEAEAGPTA